MQHFVANQVQFVPVKRAVKKLVWLIGITAGLCGGWMAAGSLNDGRVDIPRQVMPATQPSNTTAAPAH